MPPDSVLRRISYSLFGDTVIVKAGPTVDGQMMYDELSPSNPTVVVTLLFCAIFFAIYMYFYLSPLFRKNHPRHPTAGNYITVNSTAPPSPNTNIDTEKNAPLPLEQKTTLLSSFCRLLPGRFDHTTALSPSHLQPPSPSSTANDRRAILRINSYNYNRSHSPNHPPSERGRYSPPSLLSGHAPSSCASSLRSGSSYSSSATPLITPPAPTYATRSCSCPGTSLALYECKEHQYQHQYPYMWDPANHAGYRSYYDASPTSFYDPGLTAGTMEKLHLSLNMDWPGPPPLMLLSSPPRSQPKSPLLRPKSPLRSDVVSRRGSMLPTVYEHHQDGESGVWESEDGSQQRQSQTQMQVDKEEENQDMSKENDDGCVRGKEKGKGKEKETLRVS